MHLPAQILPSCKERFAVHFSRLKEFVHCQRQFNIELLLYTIILKCYIQRWCVCVRQEEERNTNDWIKLMQRCVGCLDLNNLPAKSSKHSAVSICWICAPASSVGSTGLIWTLSLRAFSGDHDKIGLKFYKEWRSETELVKADLIQLCFKSHSTYLKCSLSFIAIE